MTATLILALVIAAPARTDPPKTDPPGPVGRWTVESATFAGMALPKLDHTIPFTADGKCETHSAAGDTMMSGTFTFDPTKDPPEMDISEPTNAGKVSAAIYKLNGDTLTICTSTDGERPKAFDAPGGSKFVLLVLKRIKD
jgi:uncharacterized protein (TIGR03067 family)